MTCIAAEMGLHGGLCMSDEQVETSMLGLYASVAICAVNEAQYAALPLHQFQTYFVLLQVREKSACARLCFMTHGSMSCILTMKPSLLMRIPCKSTVVLCWQQLQVRIKKGTLCLCSRCKTGQLWLPAQAALSS